MELLTVGLALVPTVFVVIGLVLIAGSAGVQYANHITIPEKARILTAALGISCTIVGVLMFFYLASHLQINTQVANPPADRSVRNPKTDSFLGGLDLHDYCVSEWGSDATAEIPGEKIGPFDWECVEIDGNGQKKSHPIVFDEVCKEQHQNPQAYAAPDPDDPFNALKLYCYEQP